LLAARGPEVVRHTLCRLHERLAAAATLEPGPAVDALFAELVWLVRHSPGEHAEQVLSDPIVRALQPSLHRLCSAGEYHLERAWAARILASADPLRELRRFPYYDNYRQLTRLEHHALEGLGLGRIRRVAFVGSGPLPLSSILLSQEFGLRVDNLDVDRGAIELSARLAAALGLDDLGFLHSDLLDWTALEAYDLVVLAALVGLDRSEKLRVLDHLGVHMSPGALLLVRTSHALKALLYPTVHVDDLVGFVPQLVVQPLNDVINSIIVAQR
jgi:nicotianamine synthase